MKKCLQFLSILIFSCNQPTVSNSPKIVERKLETYCDSFIYSHNDWKQNDILHDKANADLEKDLSYKISNGLLSDFPLELKLINEYEPGKYAAHFSTLYTIKTKYDFNFDVIALISKTIGEKLKTDSLYGITGRFKKFLDLDFKRYTYAMAYSNKVEIRKDDIYEDSAAFDLGIILMDNPEIKRIN